MGLSYENLDEIGIDLKSFSTPSDFFLIIF